MLNFIPNLILRVYADTVNITPINPNIPGVTGNSPLDIIAGFYKFALAVSGLLAIGVIVYGAIKYATNPGSAGNLSDAKEWIYSALLGMLLLGGAYFVLSLINPELTLLHLPTLTKVAPPTAASTTPGTTPGAFKCATGSCVPIGLPWVYKNGNQADPVMVQELTCVANKGITLRITEAMPQSSPHLSVKHTNGCAVDATIPGLSTSADCSKLTQVGAAITSCGGNYLNEYYNTCGGQNTEHSTGEHIHINANCGM